MIFVVAVEGIYFADYYDEHWIWGPWQAGARSTSCPWEAAYRAIAFVLTDLRNDHKELSAFVNRSRYKYRA